jgi:hypothetical protein
MLGLSLVGRWAVVASLRWMMGLLLVYMTALAWTWWQGLDLHCGCLGSIDWVEDQPSALLRDAVLFTLSFWLLRAGPALERASIRRRSPA